MTEFVSYAGPVGRRPRVLIAALNPPPSLANVPAMLAMSACRTTVLCADNSSLARSWFVERRITVECDESAVLEALRDEVSRERFDLVVVGDEALLQALMRRTEPWIDSVLPFRADAETRRLIADKHALLRAVAARGIAVPPFITVAAAADLRAAADAIGYPLVLKDAEGCAGAGVRRVDAPAELLAAYHSLARAGEVAVQRFLPAQPGCTDVLFDRGVPRCWTSAFMLEQWPTPFAGCTVRRPASVRGVEEMLRAVGSVTGFHGLGGIDWLQDDDGRPYFLEFNARMTHIVGPARRAFGIQIGAMLAGTSATEQEVVLPGSAIAIFPGHLVRALKSRRAEVLQWLPFRKTSADLDWRDFGVTSAELGGMARAAAARIVTVLVQRLSAIASISMRAPRGRPAAATVERAGGTAPSNDSP